MTTLAFFLIGYLVAVLNSLLLDWLKRRRDGYIQIEAMLETQDGSSVPSIVRFEEMEFKEEGKV